VYNGVRNFKKKKKLASLPTAKKQCRDWLFSNCPAAVRKHPGHGRVIMSDALSCTQKRRFICSLCARRSCSFSEKEKKKHLTTEQRNAMFKVRINLRAITVCKDWEDVFAGWPKFIKKTVCIWGIINHAPPRALKTVHARSLEYLPAEISLPYTLKLLYISLFVFFTSLWFTP
jgi:hypothetical protein